MIQYFCDESSPFIDSDGTGWVDLNQPPPISHRAVFCLNSPAIWPNGLSMELLRNGAC